MTIDIHPSSAIHMSSATAPAGVADRGWSYTKSDLQDFLRDPIGHGSYDFDDPISLAEFSQSKHLHRYFVEVLA